MSCSETVLQLGLEKLLRDSEDARKISRTFDGGMVGRGEVCGTVTGAVLAF